MKKLFTKFTLRIKFIFITASLLFFAGFAIAQTTNTQTEEDEDALNPDRPDLAMEQEIRITKDLTLGYAPRERLATAWSMVKQQKTQKIINPLTVANWTERGPNNVGGRTRAIMFDPNDATHKKIWAGGVGGGLWYTNDITVASPVWNNVNDFWANIAISSIAYDPSSTNTFYVGTGEGWFNADAIQGAGIWKTTDGGSTWNQLASTNNANFYYVQKVVVASNGNVFASTRTNGLYRSADGGTSWTKVLGAGTGASTNSAADIEIGADGTIYASMGIFTTDGVYSSSTGAAASWTKLNTGVNGFPTSGFYRLEIGVAPSDANTLYVMAQDASTDGLFNIYSSTDKGANWTALGLPTWCDQGSSTTDMTRGQGWYDLILAVDPNNASNVFAGGVDVMKSVNGGSTWTQATAWGCCCGGMPNIHADQHSIVFQPGSSSVMVFGNDGGIYYTANGGTTITNKNSGYNVTQFYACAMNPASGSNNFLAGAQDNGSQKFTTAGMNSTTQASGGDGAFCHIDQTNSNYQLTSYVYNYVYLSTNGGTSFATLNPDQSHGDFINPSDYDDANGIFYSSYSTTQLNRISGIRSSPSAPTQITITGMSAKAGNIRVSPFAPGGTTTLFIGTQNGKLFKATNAQAVPTITEIDGGSLPVGTISCVEIGASEQDLLITFSNYGMNSVWRTTDGGTTWANKDNATLPDMPIRWAIYNPNDLKEVLLATEVGVWSTSDITVASPTWASNANGLANVRVDMFQYRSSDQMLIAATHGRGLFSSDVFVPSSGAPVAAFSGSPTTVCIGSNVTFTDASTNTPTSWSWIFPGGNPSTSISQNPVVTYTAAGTFSVSLTATNGSGNNTLSKTNYITVNALPVINISASPSATICNGASVTLTASGGTSYSWNTSATTTNITVSPTINTTYTVTGTNANNCSANATKTITVNSLPNISVSTNPSSTICSGSNVTLTASGGNTYSWSTGQTITSIIVSPTTTKTYTVAGTNANNCSKNTTQTITVNTPTISINASPSATICTGINVTLTASGGTSYSWNTTATTTSIIVSPIVNTTYTVIGTNASACTNTATKTITINSTPPTITINVSPSSTICSGTNATLTASGGVSYSWWNSGQTTTSIVVNPTANTSYTVTGTSAGGCTNTASATITVNSVSPVINISSNPSSSICAGQTTTLSASGGTSYSWNTASTKTSISVSPTSNTTYTVTGTTGGCSSTTTITVVASPQPTVNITSPAANICTGSSMTLTANGGVSYLWNTGATTASIIVNPTTSTTYTVTGTNANSCSKKATKTIGVYALPNISVNASASATICNGQSVTLTASGGTSYSWNNGSTKASITISPTTNTTYTVTGTNANGCSNIATKTITVNPLPSNIISAAPSTTICSGTSVTLSASAGNFYSWNTGATTSDIILIPTSSSNYSATITDANGCSSIGSQYVTISFITVNIASAPSSNICIAASVTLSAFGGNSYVWNTGATTTSITATPTSTTTYSLTGTNTNGCMNSNSKTITVNSLPIISISANPATICSGSLVTLAASGGSVYSWNTNASSSTIIVSPSANSTYSVIGTNANGCSNTALQIVIVNSLPVISISSNPSATICNGSSTTLSASGGISYSWNIAATTSDIAVSPTTNTNYVVTGTDVNGCTKSIGQTVTVSNPAASISTAPSSTICNGDSVTLTASGGTFYSWNTGATTTSITDNPSSTTSYSVTSTNIFGCTKTAVKTITVDSLPVIAISANPSAIICSGSHITLTASGGNSYNWNTGATTSVINVHPTTNTTYTVSGKNSNGCSSPASISISVNPIPILSVTSTDASCSTCCDGTANVNASGASPFSYAWNPGGITTQSDSGICHGNYTVCVTDSNGCNTCDTTNVNVATGISSVSQENSIAIFPNPSKGEFTIFNIPFAVCNLEIYSVIGEKIYSDKIIHRITYNVHSNLPSGVYFIKIISSENNVCTKKLIVE